LVSAALTTSGTGRLAITNITDHYSKLIELNDSKPTMPDLALCRIIPVNVFCMTIARIALEIETFNIEELIKLQLAIEKRKNKICRLCIVFCMGSET